MLISWIFQIKHRNDQLQAAVLRRRGHRAGRRHQRSHRCTQSAMQDKTVAAQNIFINLKYFYNTFIQKYLQRAPATCCSRMRSRATPPRPGTRPRTRWPTHSPSSGAAAASRTPSAPTPWPTAAPLRVSRWRTSGMANITHFRLHTQCPITVASSCRI